MSKLRIKKTSRSSFLTYAMVIVLFVVLQTMSSAGMLSSSMKGQLVPICAYVVMALSLNLTVGILGELSLGHAGFMSVGAFAGAVAASALQNAIPGAGLRLAVAMVIGAVVAGIAGVLIGIPVLRLKGDYLAIVTLAFGEIIKSIVNNLYIGIDDRGLHASLMNNTISLGEGGRMILSGPMGIPGIAKISTFVAGFILIMIGLSLFTGKTKMGKAMRAVSEDKGAAQLMGINVNTTISVTFAIGSALAAVAGVLLCSSYPILVPTTGSMPGIKAFTAAVFGGIGSIPGALLGGVLLGVIEIFAKAYISTQLSDAIVFAVLIIVLLVKPTGLWGKQIREKV